MAIKSLTDEQVHTWTREQKDRWWLAEVFRGDMPQLTLRSAATGFFLGGLLSATNLYVGAKTGITLGVGLTSVILAFAMFKVFSAIRREWDFTILENNAMQSIATSAGYMTAPIVSCFVAYMWKADVRMPWYQILVWNVLTALMGVLVAFPMKRKFINDEQQPFPEGRACGVVLDALYTGQSSKGMLQAKALVFAGLLTAGVQVCIGEAYMRVLWVRLLGQKAYYYLNDKLDAWYYALAAKHDWIVPKILSIDIRQLALRPTFELAMIGTGGLMGLRTATSMLLGMLVNFVILAPWMIRRGDILTAKIPSLGEKVTYDRAQELLAAGTIKASDIAFGRTEIVNQWAIWWGVGIMVVGSLVALFAKPKMILDPFKAMFGRKSQETDVLAHIELPFRWSLVGIPILAVIAAYLAHEWYGMAYWLTLLCLPLVFALSLICTNSMALTSWTPTGSLSKITQFTFGVLDRANPATNLMTAGITASVASNAANLLSDIKPGYMLGAKPRQQALGHVIGIFSGAIACTLLFYPLFLGNYDAAKPIQDQMTTEKFTFPAALQWKGVADIISGGFSGLSPSILWSLGVASVAAVVFEVLRISSRGKFPLSPVSIGLGVVLPPDATFMMFVGAVFFHFMHGRFKQKEGTFGKRLWVDSMEPICAGMIAGAALIGIGDKLVEVFILDR